MPSTTTFALFNKRASARECRKRLNYLLSLTHSLTQSHCINGVKMQSVGRVAGEMKSLRSSIVSQLVDLTHSLCYWNTTRGALRLCIWLYGGVEARQLVLSPVSLEYTPCKSWPLWCGVLTFAYLRPSRSRRPLYERVNQAARLHRIHDMRNWCICPRRRRWTGK